MALDGAHGRRWYADSVDDVHAAAASMGVAPDRFAAVLAVLSPRVSVRRNVQHTVRYLRTGTLGADVLPSNLVALATYERTGRINGPKTGAFARAVLGDPDALVLDTWIAKALGVPQEKLPNAPIRREAARRFRAVASRTGWTVAETQAAVWYSAIRLFPDRRGRHTYASPPLLGTLIREELARA